MLKEEAEAGSKSAWNKLYYMPAQADRCTAILPFNGNSSAPGMRCSACKVHAGCTSTVQDAMHKQTALVCTGMQGLCGGWHQLVHRMCWRAGWSSRTGSGWLGVERGDLCR